MNPDGRNNKQMIQVGWIKLVLCDGELVEPSNYETLWHTYAELQRVYYEAGEILIIIMLTTCRPRESAIFFYRKSKRKSSCEQSKLCIKPNIDMLAPY